MTGAQADEGVLAASLDAPVGSIGFAGPSHPLPFHQIAFEDCVLAAGDIPAKPLAELSVNASTFLVGLTAIDSGNARIKVNGADVPDGLSRVPDRLCRTPIASNYGTKLLFWPKGPHSGGFQITSWAGLLMLNDSGVAIEVSRLSKPGQPLHIVQHDIGGTSVKTAIDRAPTLAQYGEMAAGTSSFLNGTKAYAEYDAAGHFTLHVTP